ncbi:MAG: alpha/beta hydrolase [Flavobacteriales bacterium]|nr:alpha/beta hydrolase [Flavobacteriales bacterium]
MNLLLLHGALGTRQQLGILREVLPGVHTRTLEFRGHGERGIPDEGLSMEVFVRDIRDAMQEAGWSEAHFFGYSMGGYAALLYASRFPEQVASVVTLGTKLKWDREGLDRELRLLDPQKMKEKVPQFAMDLLIQHGSERWEDLVRATAGLITGLHEQPPLTRESMERITCPAMLCVGDRDRTAVPEHTLEAARWMPRGSTLVLPNTQHPFDHVDLNVLVHHLRSFWGQEVEADQP